LWQAIRKHEFVKVLQDPGSADLSAYVDFAAIKHAVEDEAGKSSFLKSLHCSSHLNGCTKFSC
jgi:SAM-dependent MidA family methyltransferase